MKHTKPNSPCRPARPNSCIVYANDEFLAFPPLCPFFSSVVVVVDLVL